MRVIATRLYERRADRLMSADERIVAEAKILARPGSWPVIPGTGGARKARIALFGRGKRGGGRLIYFYRASPALLVLLDVYAKNEKDNLSHADKEDIRAAISEVRNSV